MLGGVSGVQPRLDRPRPELQVGERDEALSLAAGTQLERGVVLDVPRGRSSTCRRKSVVAGVDIRRWVCVVFSSYRRDNVKQAREMTQLPAR